MPRALKVKVGVGAAAVLLIAAFATAVLVGMLAPGGDTTPLPAVAVTAGAASGRSITPSPTPTFVIYVHVLGAVVHPGLYTLPEGARVIDAVGAAGGLTKDAEQSGVNLARPIQDGEQLVVPKVGEVVAPIGSSAGGAGAGGASGEALGGKVNLNTADQEQLETLPRVGPATAAKIIAWRTENGRFTSVEDLMNVDGIGQKTFDGLKSSVTV